MFRVLNTGMPPGRTLHRQGSRQRIAMQRQYLALNSALFFWLLALIAWGSHVTWLIWLSAGLSLCAFLLQALLMQVNAMFKKHKQIEITQPVAAAIATTAVEKEPANPDKHATTVIASDVRFEGNILSTGHVYIYGFLQGNIDAKDNLIKIMRGGQVEGNIVCRELIIDGNVTGQCTVDTVDIYENGSMFGTLAYRTLSVKKGGMFSGQAEVLPAETEKSNVVGLLVDNPQETSTGKRQKAPESASTVLPH